DQGELQRVRQIYGISGDYILSVGSIQPRKNLTRLISAYMRLRLARPEEKLPQLVIVGKRAWRYRETVLAIEKVGAGAVIVDTGYVPAADLPALYSGAVCFVYDR
ncbi:MAG: glycosyltransferase, partial [Pyrinomonadaceae bacterium]